MASIQTTVEQTRRLVGLPVKRVEDPKFITGGGRYVDDVSLRGTLTAYFVRSLHAHARIRVNPTPGLRSPGVVAILTGADLKGMKDMPTVPPESNKSPTRRPVLAGNEVNYAGEPIAVILAENAYAAEDGAELVEVEYEPLEAVEDVLEALKPNSPKVHDYLSNNISSWDSYESGDLQKAFAEADEVIKVALVNQRVAVAPMEPRAILANYDSGSEILTIYASTQAPHGLRDEIANLMNLHASKVRLIAPDVGGGFGLKFGAFNEDLVICYASMVLNRPVKWVESRRENMIASPHGRGQNQYAEIAMRRDGKILGLKTRIISDSGAYATPTAVGLPHLTYMMGTGVYDIPAYGAEIVTVMTNKVPQGAYRGAGRPEAAYLIERSVNIIARKLKLDPVRIRRANFIPREKFPFKTRSGVTYDSGDYDHNLNRALLACNYETLRAEQREARAKGRLVGLGISTWVEIAGFGPEQGQSAAITVTPQGEVVLIYGGHPHGQGHATPFSQLVADELGVDIAKIQTHEGDTGMLPWSSGTGGSRSGAVTGGAVYMAAKKARDKMEKIAAHILQVPVGSKMVFENGKIYHDGDRTRSVEFEKVAETAYKPTSLPQGMEATIFEYAVFTPPSNGYPFGTHIALVEVERATGVVKLLKYFATDDCGKLLNPLIVEGQVHGGVVQGIGQAMLEQIVYDQNGQPLTSTLADYAIPSADMLPVISWTRTETPTTANPMGVKGIGEAGSIASTPTIVNAVEDALSQFDVTVDLMPVRPDYIKSLIDGNHKPTAQQNLWEPLVHPHRGKKEESKVDESAAML